MRAGERVLPLEGGRNFRDLGGYPTEDGHTVRWGRLYRSGAMTNLTDADFRHLSDLGIRAVCDFRCNEEREHEPANWSALPGIDYRTWDYTRRDELEGGNSLASLLGKQDLTPDKVAAIMVKAYLSYMTQHRDRYKELFQRLAKGAVPLVFNCSAGKDRTGVAAALVLSALGVPRSVVVQDYTLSDKVVDFEAELLRNRETREPRQDDLYQWATVAPIELVRPVLRSPPDYIESALTHLDETYGGVIDYVRAELLIGNRDLTRIRGMMLD